MSDGIDVAISYLGGIAMPSINDAGKHVRVNAQGNNYEYFDGNAPLAAVVVNALVERLLDLGPAISHPAEFPNGVFPDGSLHGPSALLRESNGSIILVSRDAEQMTRFHDRSQIETTSWALAYPTNFRGHCGGIVPHSAGSRTVIVGAHSTDFQSKSVYVGSHFASLSAKSLPDNPGANGLEAFATADGYSYFAQGFVDASTRFYRMTPYDAGEVITAHSKPSSVFYGSHCMIARGQTVAIYGQDTTSFGAQHKVYYSLNRGDTWSTSAVGPTTNNFRPLCIAWSDTFAKWVVIGADLRVHAASDLAGPWEQVAAGPASANFTSAISVCFVDPCIVATFNKTDTPARAGLAVSKDLGLTYATRPLQLNCRLLWSGYELLVSNDFGFEFYFSPPSATVSI